MLDIILQAEKYYLIWKLHIEPARDKHNIEELFFLSFFFFIPFFFFFFFYL